MEDSTAPLPAQPDNSNATLRIHGQEVVIQFPPWGIFPAYTGHIVISLLVIAIAPLTFALGLWVAHKFQTYEILKRFWVITAAIAALGLYLLGSTIYWGRARIEIEAEPTKLSITIAEPFWTWQRRWVRSKLLNVNPAYRDLDLLKKGVREPVRIHMAQHPLDILWTVKMIRWAMDLDPSPNTPTLLPKKTRVTSHRTGEFLHLALRPYRTEKGALLSTLVLWLAATTTQNFLQLYSPGQNHSPKLAAINIALLWLCFSPVIWSFAHQLTHSTFLDILPDELAIARPGWFRILKRRWRRSQILHVVVPGRCLILWFKDRGRIRKMTLWESNKPAELHWVAETIRKEMNLND
jgi:hypothetical protein